MRRFNRHNAAGSGRNLSLLLHRLVNCSHDSSVEDIVKYLHLQYPEYKRMSAAVLTKNIQAALSTKRKNKRKGNYMNDIGRDVEVGKSTSSPSSSSSSLLDSMSGSISRQVSDPKFDLMKTMLRESYSIYEVESDETGESRKKTKETRKREVLDIEEDVVKKSAAELLGRGATGGTERKGSLNQDKGRGPMFKDFGGMGQVLEELKFKVLIPLHYPELLNRLRQLHAGPPTGILLHGPPGCGKTMLAQAIANEAGVPFFQIAAPEIVSGVSGQSEENIRELFSKARRTSPSVIIFIDEIDAIAEKRENLQKGMEGRILTQLLKCMDNIQEHASSVGPESSDCENRLGHVLVIGATNRPNSLDPALRRTGQFSWEIELGVLDENARFEILSVLTRDLNVQGGLDLRKMARDTHGFVGADLEGYVGQACQLALRK